MTKTLPPWLPQSYKTLVSDQLTHQFRHKNTGTTIWTFGSLNPSDENYLFKLVSIDGKMVPLSSATAGFGITELVTTRDTPESLANTDLHFAFARSEDGDFLFFNGNAQASIWLFRHDEQSASEVAASFDKWINKATSCTGKVVGSNLSNASIPIVGTWRAHRSPIFSQRLIDALPVIEITADGRWIETFEKRNIKYEGTAELKMGKPPQLIVGINGRIRRYKITSTTDTSLTLMGPDSADSVEHIRVNPSA
ncbi:MAG: SMI1/KNR4 family protein [Planctomycetes bacterium]|nr:SMI1/KNR4 family protein [Planctomycetota bacterium]